MLILDGNDLINVLLSHCVVKIMLRCRAIALGVGYFEHDTVKLPF